MSSIDPIAAGILKEWKEAGGIYTLAAEEIEAELEVELRRSG